MIKKQHGKLIDTTSERSLTKFWTGVDFQVFNTQDIQIQYNLSQPVQEDVKGKDKKKDPKQAEQ